MEICGITRNEENKKQMHKGSHGVTVQCVPFFTRQIKWHAEEIWLWEITFQKKKQPKKNPSLSMGIIFLQIVKKKKKKKQEKKKLL